jgi:hypothetical protein
VIEPGSLLHSLERRYDRRRMDSASDHRLDPNRGWSMTHIT